MSGRDPATSAVAKLLTESETGDARLLMSAINVGEVYYFLRKNGRAELAESWRDQSAVLPVTIEVPAIDEVWDAAVLKGSYSIAVADAFAAALAQKYRCPLVTGDPEFQSISDLQLDWIGRTV
jgi:predicted nucleic acid-binding protein